MKRSGRIAERDSIFKVYAGAIFTLIVGIKSELLQRPGKERRKATTSTDLSSLKLLM